MHSTASAVGSFVGGFIAVFVLSLIWEKLGFRRVIHNGVACKLASVTMAWITAGVLGGFGLAVDEAFNWSSFGRYLAPAIVVAIIAFFTGYGRRADRGGGV